MLITDLAAAAETMLRLCDEYGHHSRQDRVNRGCCRKTPSSSTPVCCDTSDRWKTPKKSN